jgi:hypothetical protein
VIDVMNCALTCGEWHELRFVLLIPAGCTGQDTGAHMFDKHRHSRTPTPRGGMSGWALTVFLVCAGLIAGLARSIV